MKTRTRISVTLTKLYVEGLDKLVEEGLYLNRGQIMLDALRHLFRIYGMVPSAEESEG